MSVTQIRSEINEYLNQVDSHFLKVVHAMLNTYLEEKENTVIGYTIEGEPILAKEAKVAYLKRVENMKKGDFITLKDLEKEVQK
jgi:hypothetical protein